MVLNELGEVEAQLRQYFQRKHPAFFRVHVAGDFINHEYADMWMRVAAEFSETKFLAFTKAFDIAGQIQPPANFSLVLSGWPGINIPSGASTRYQTAWMQDGTETRIPDSAITCPGHRDSCGMCWHLPRLGRDVVFHKH